MTLSFGPLELAAPDLTQGTWPILDDAGAHRLSADQRRLLGGEGINRYPTVLPYAAQDGYGRDTGVRPTPAAVLDNGRLRATFLLDWGGRLWSLVDLEGGRELLHRPDVLQVGNLALRNAWFAGGVEWNLGFTGHWGLTCEPVCAGRVSAPDGTPVLRLWAFERLLRLVWRIDAWLHGAALYVRPVLRNPWPHPVPVYWWSNIAVVQAEDTRVLADAGQAWNFDGSGLLSRLPFPGDGFDQSYPARYPAAADRFLEVRCEHPWIAAVDADGHGLGQSSTARLAGRKLFTWGAGRGGRRWQQWLSGTGQYAEIQSGLARTQLEHLPLAAGQSWTWTESFRAVDVGTAAGAPWTEAVTGAARVAMDPGLLDAETALAAVQDAAVDVERSGDGWGALEVVAGHLDDSPATPFRDSALGAEQQPWLALLGTSELAGPARPVTGEPWRQRLTGTGQHSRLHRGYLALARGDVALAEQEFQAAGALPEALRARARLATGTARADLYETALAAGEPVDQLVTEAATAFADQGRWQRVLDLVGAAAQGRRGVLACRALVGVGRLADARRLLDQPLVLPDLREGDDPLADLWREYTAATGTVEPLPERYDFALHSSH